MHVVPRYTLPPIVNTFDPSAISGLQQSVNPKASTGATGTTTGTSSTTSADGGLGATFLNLLSTELQNQDPTAPVDSTAMVGQMISLNQLDQLININQTLSAASTTTTTTPTTPTTGSAQPASAAVSPSSTAPNQLPFNPDTMMPVNPALSPTPFDPSSTSNNTSGGK